MIPYGRQDISQADITAVVEVLQSDFLTQGPMIPFFEKKVAEYCNVKYGFAVNSATSALHLACLALDLGPGDILWTSPITFVASANCALYCGAKVDFVDIDCRTYNMCTKALENKLIEAERTDNLPKIVVPVHFSGQSCDMKVIYDLSQRYGFKIIEDASHAIGGKYEGEAIGNCRYSDISVFSFHPVKIITTAEGGMLLTDNSMLAERVALLRSHGITRDESLMNRKPDGPWYYEQIDLGFNYRMTELQAGLGASQMVRLEQFVSKRHQLALRYNIHLRDLPLSIPYQESTNYSAMHLYVVCLKLDDIKLSHLQVFETLREKGIGVNLHYIPVHIQPYYKRMGFKIGQFPMAEKYYSEAISLPMYSAMTEEQQDTVIEAMYSTLNLSN